MRTGDSGARSVWVRLAVAAVVCAVLIAGLAGIAWAQGVWPPLPSDAEVDAFIKENVALWHSQHHIQMTRACPTCGDTVISEPQITKMHFASADRDPARGNVLIYDFKTTDGPQIDGSWQVRYYLFFARIPEPPNPLKVDDPGFTQYSWRSRDDLWSQFNSGRGRSLLPDWDTRPVTRYATAVPATPRPVNPTVAPLLPECAAKISVPPNLKPGDTLSPSADVTSTDGKPVQGTLGLVWTINGVQANSVTWDGKAAAIRLDLSCQGRAQSFNYTVPPFGVTPTPGTPTPPAPPTPAPPTATRAAPAPNQPADGDAEGDVPGLGSAGGLPGPKDLGQGLVGGLLPGLLGLLGALLAGAGSGGTAPAATGGVTPPVAPVPPVAPTGGRPAGAGDGKGTGEKPKPDGGKTAPVDPKSHAQASAQKAAAAQATAAGSDTWGGALRDAASAAGNAVGKFGKDVGNVVVSAVESVGTGVKGIVNAVRNPGMFVKGLKAEISAMAAPAREDSLAANQALKDGRYGDYAKSTVSGMGKIIGSLGTKAVNIAVNAAKQASPKDEIESLLDPNASLEEKLWAIPSAATKIAGILVGTKAGWKPVGGVPAPRVIPTVAPNVAPAAGQATRAAAADAGAAGTRAGAATGTAAADAGAAGTRAGAASRPPTSSSGLVPTDGGLQAPGARTLVNAPGGATPNLQGMPRSQANTLANIAQRRGVDIAVRPSNPAGTPWLQSGRAVPKPPDVHVGSLDDTDALIGGPSGRNGLVGHFEPVRPANLSQMSPEMQTAVNQRYTQRAAEWQTQSANMQRLQQQGRIRVADGVVYDGATGRPLVTDTDLGGIYRNGVPVPADEARMIVREIRQSCPGVTHGDVNSWYAVGQEQRGIMNNTMGRHTVGNTAMPTVGADGQWRSTYFGDRVAP